MAKRPAKKAARRKVRARPKSKTAHAADAGLRDRRGQTISEVTAADLKNRTGGVLNQVLTHGTLAITRHHVPHAVLVSVPEYLALLQRAPDPIKTLKKEFDALIAKMQTPKAQAAVRAVGTATTAQLGAAARTYHLQEGKRRR
jgi:antitoxin Phd